MTSAAALVVSEAVVNIIGMIGITVLLVVAVMPISNERVFRVMCLTAAAVLFILVIQHS